MTKKEVIELMRTVFEKSFNATYDSDDVSGLNPRYQLDQGRLLQALDEELEKEEQP